jgi:hypothetical protein
VTYWNNRVLTDGKDYWVGEVYYDDDGTYWGYTGKEEDPVGAWGDFIDLSNCVHHLVGALDQPILEIDENETIIGEITLADAMAKDLHKAEPVDIVDNVTSTTEERDTNG